MNTNLKAKLNLALMEYPAMSSPLDGARLVPDDGDHTATHRQRYKQVSRTVLQVAAKSILKEYENDETSIGMVIKFILQRVADGSLLIEIDELFQALPDWMASEHVMQYVKDASQFIISKHPDIREMTNGQ